MKVTYNSEEVGNLVAAHYRGLFLLSPDAKLLVNIRLGDHESLVEVQIDKTKAEDK